MDGRVPTQHHTFTMGLGTYTMRSSRAFSLVAAAALLAACGDGGGGPSNALPTAKFNAPTCTLLACSFSGLPSSDADGTVDAYSWNFGDPTSGSNTAATRDANHTFSAAGTYTVTLTVTDNDGGSDDATRQVIVSTTANSAPTADFSFSCTDLDCDFTDQSSDVDGTIASREWDFGDGQAGTGASPMHTYAAGGSYNVTVTATDNLGAATTSAVQVVQVTPASSGGPSASFDVTCSSLDCTITNTSTATASATWAWDFGNGTNSTAKDPAPVHYTVTGVTQFTITLVVTDGAKTSQTSKTVRVVPAATLTCNDIACTLGIEADATVIVTLVSHDCVAHGNTFVLTAPAVDTLFTDGCYAPVAPDPGSSFALNNGAAYTAGTQLDAEVLTGVTGAQNPKIRVTGDFQNGWTLEFDDGFVGPGEPDFNDLIITVVATPTGP
jgi:PKD repeat protein